MKGAVLQKLLGIRSAACVPWLLPLNPGADCQFLYYLSDPFTEAQCVDQWPAAGESVVSRAVLEIV